MSNRNLGHGSPALIVAMALFCACDNTSVEETGYFVGGSLDYTAPEFLSGQDVIVTLVGESGIFPQSGGTVTVENTRTGDPALLVLVSPDGGFLATVAAQQDDILDLHFTTDVNSGVVELLLSDKLDVLAAPSCLVCASTLASAPDGEGLSTLDVGALGITSGFVVAFNEANGSTLRLPAPVTSAAIPATIGDRICVFQRAPNGNQSVTLCELVPAI